MKKPNKSKKVKVIQWYGDYPEALDVKSLVYEATKEGIEHLVDNLREQIESNSDTETIKLKIGYMLQKELDKIIDVS